MSELSLGVPELQAVIMALGGEIQALKGDMQGLRLTVVHAGEEDGEAIAPAEAAPERSPIAARRRPSALAERAA